MNSNWIWILPVFGAGLFVPILLMMRMVRRERERSQVEIAELRGLVETLRSEVADQKVELQDLAAIQRQASVEPPAQVAPLPPRFAPTATLSADKRAEALEMLRLGADSGTVSSRLQLSPAEAELLEKVQNILGPPAGR